MLYDNRWDLFNHLIWCRVLHDCAMWILFVRLMWLTLLCKLTVTYVRCLAGVGCRFHDCQIVQDRVYAQCWYEQQTTRLITPRPRISSVINHVLLCGSVWHDWVSERHWQWLSGDTRDWVWRINFSFLQPCKPFELMPYSEASSLDGEAVQMPETFYFTLKFTV